MKVYITLFIFLIPRISLTQDINLWQGDEKYNEAAKNIQKALLSYPLAKKARKKIENKIYDKISIEKETAAIIGSTALTISKGSIDTKVIKKMDLGILGAVVRPDVNYNFKDGSSSGTVNINWGF